ncbi:MAG: phosphonate transporter, periplasmic phosphonate-binding protein [Holophagaceae bacterium]|nr:phosphonate transporter, periplasmic phosphonate-binding protein [Holophagaceae bacterium]
MVLALGFSMGGMACRPDLAERYSPDYAPAPPSQTEYVFAVHPLHNPTRLLEVYGPIVDRLNARIPQARFRFEASRNYAEFERKLHQRQIHFALPNPYQTVRCLHNGYRVFGKMGDDHLFRGILLVRADRGIQRVADLKGKAISYPAPTALAATLMPQFYLHTHGLDVNHDVQSVYVGSQESSIMNVHLGLSAAGATWPVPWQAFQLHHADRAKDLKVLFETESLPNNALVVRDDVPADLVRQVAAVLVGLKADVEGRRFLAEIPISCFEPATEATYEPVRRYLHRFSSQVRSIETGGL